MNRIKVEDTIIRSNTLHKFMEIMDEDTGVLHPITLCEVYIPGAGFMPVIQALAYGLAYVDPCGDDSMFFVRDIESCARIMEGSDFHE